MAEIGQQLFSPEKGWVRFNNNHSMFTYEGNWRYENTVKKYFNSDVHYTESIGDICKFNFLGTGLRIISLKNNGIGVADNIKITIDGEEFFYSNNGETQMFQVLLFEKLNLELKQHEVIIESIQNKALYMDCIDILPRLIGVNNIQISSKEYSSENVIRKDYIGTLDTCTLSKIEILETSNKVSNNEIHQENIRTLSEDKFILE